MALHQVIASALRGFSESNDIQDLEENAQFEHFTNYCVIAPLAATQIDAQDVTTGSDDESIDGVAVLLDGVLVTSHEGCSEYFDETASGRDVAVEYIFNQAKTSVTFDLGELLKFASGVRSLFAADLKSEGREQ